MSFESIQLEGNLFSKDFLNRVQAGDLPGMATREYTALGGRLEDHVTQAWKQAENLWQRFSLHKSRAQDVEDEYRITRDHFVAGLFEILGFPHRVEGKPLRVEGKTYPIRFGEGAIPVHVVACTQDLDKGPDGTARGNPHSLVQEYLNRSPDATWGVITNGQRFRILRDNAASTRPAFVEFDLNAIMEGQQFDEWGVFWRIAHWTRFEGEEPYLEQWMREAAKVGVRALDALRRGVEEAIEVLGKGFLAHPRNQELVKALQSGKLSHQDYFHEVLRLVYRLLFLFVTEDRGLLLHPEASEKSRRAYMDYYSTRRLRKMARNRGSQHHDLFEGLKVVMDGLKSSAGQKQLGLPALNSALWSNEFIPHLDASRIRNADLLHAVHRLSRIKTKQGWQNIDYANLGAEELGSVYESLLDQHAVIDADNRTFELQHGGTERRTTGSHYTPTELIDKVLDHALDPLLDEAMETGETPQEQEKNLLELTVCDPTSGSGHFLVAAAHRMARRVAQARTGEEEPAPGDLRHALRDVISRCIYGVDINPMAVELCKVSLWLEAMEPGKPLAFLDHHIKCGNALLGAFPEYLERGIPDEAYKVRPGIDNPEVCKELKKINKKVPMTQETLKHFKQDRKRIQDYLAQTLEEIEAMPTDTVEQIEAKEDAYRTRYLETDEYGRYKLALDAWCAAFSYRKVALGSEAHIGNPALLDILNEDVQTEAEVLKTVRVSARESRNQFFHWMIEFPAVFQTGGFHSIVGNPPYLGGGRVSTNLGHHYNHYMLAVFDRYSPLGDLAAGFLRRFAMLSSPTSSRVGMITTNTISSGATRKSGLASLLSEGRAIVAAESDIEWGGEASVTVSWFVIGRPSGPRHLSDKLVDFISSRLDPLPETKPQIISCRRGNGFIGHQPAADGFVLKTAEAQKILAADPRCGEVIHPFLNGHDLLQDVAQAPRRHIICFRDMELAEAKCYPGALKIVEERVRPVREKNNRASYREYWWRFAEFRRALARTTSDLDVLIVKGRVSENPWFLRRTNDSILSDQLVVFASDSWHLVGELNSCIHEVWARMQGSGLGGTARYTPSSCFETFPVPNDSPEVARLGEAFHKSVLDHAKTRGIALTPLWNLVNDPECHDDNIEEIRRLRNELTEAVAEAFEMEAIDFRFGHYKDHADRWRYTMHPEAQEKVYLELVKLNLEQAEAKKNSNGRGGVKNESKLAKGQTTLGGKQQVRL